MKVRATVAASLAAGALALLVAALAPSGLIDHALTKLPHIATRCPDDAFVVAVFGQSQATNSGDRRRIGPLGSYAFHEGACYRLRDPVPGAQGGGGSVWPAFAEALGRPVVIVDGAVDGASIQQLAAGPLARLKRQIALARGRGLEPDVLIYMQGETNAAQKSSAILYLAYLRHLREHLPGPWLVTRQSRCGEVSGWEPLNRARFDLARLDPGVRIGPDLDRLGSEFRHDGCHLNRDGQDRVGRALARAVLREWGGGMPAYADRSALAGPQVRSR